MAPHNPVNCLIERTTIRKFCHRTPSTSYPEFLSVDHIQLLLCVSERYQFQHEPGSKNTVTETINHLGRFGRRLWVIMHSILVLPISYRMPTLCADKFRDSLMDNLWETSVCFGLKGVKRRVIFKLLLLVCQTSDVTLKTLLQMPIMDYLVRVENVIYVHLWNKRLLKDSCRLWPFFRVNRTYNWFLNERAFCSSNLQLCRLMA